MADAAFNTSRISARVAPASSAARMWPPKDLPELIPTLLPHLVNISFYRLEKQPDGEMVPVVKGVGSGYVVDAGGLIATNRHVTVEGNEFFVVVSDNSQLKADLI